MMREGVHKIEEGRLVKISIAICSLGGKFILTRNELEGETTDSICNLGILQLIS